MILNSKLFNIMICHSICTFICEHIYFEYFHDVMQILSDNAFVNVFNSLKATLKAHMYMYVFTGYENPSNYYLSLLSHMHVCSWRPIYDPLTGHAT